MILLDTNVLSALMRQTPDLAVIKWLDQQARLSLWTTSITVLEIRFGIAILSSARQQALLSEAFKKAIDEKLDGRVAAFDADSAHEASVLMAMRRGKGRTVELRDAMIAGIALAHGATLATRNTRHFDDLSTPVVNPWL
ncbi:MAG TPA: type II toxin-antitoxin system VapC family toxin [Candidatus Binataceae bacterium]